MNNQLEAEVKEYLDSSNIWKLCIGSEEYNKNAPTNKTMLENAILYAVDYTETIKSVLPSFTVHGFQHSRNVLNIMEKLLEQLELITIEKEIVSTKLSGYELAICILSAFFHDIGMCKLEGKTVEDEPLYKAYAEDKQYMDKDTLEKRYIRDKHHLRIELFLEDYQKKTDEFYWLDEEGCRKSFLDLKEICKSHNEGKKEIYSLDSNSFVDQKFFAIILRLADILDLDNTRAPLDEMKEIKFDEIEGGLYSLGEWNKHIDAEGIKFLEDRMIALMGETKNVKVYFLLERMITLIEKELHICGEVLLNAGEKFKKLNLPHGVKNNVRTKNFEAEKYTYEMQKNQVIQLFMGEDLYLDKMVFIRELLQNAIDASICYRKISKQRIEKQFRIVIPVQSVLINPVQINVWKDDNGKYSFLIMDHGIGMDRNAIKNYFLKIGNSFFKSEDFQKTGVDFVPISRFGIGFLSTYLVTDDVVVITKHYNNIDELLMLEINKNEELYVLREDKKSSNKYDASDYLYRLENKVLLEAKEALDNQGNGTIIYFQMKEDIFNDAEKEVTDAINKFLFRAPVDVKCNINGEIIEFSDDMEREFAKKTSCILDKKDICKIMKKDINSFRAEDSIILESLPLNLDYSDDGVIKGKLHLFTIYDTTKEKNIYNFSYGVNYEKDSLAIMLGGHKEEFGNMGLNKCYKVFGFHNCIKVYFNGISHLITTSTQSNRSSAYINGFIQLEGSFRPSVDVARNGLGNLDLNTKACLNYLYYKEIQKHVGADDNKRAAFFSIFPPGIMSKLDNHIYKEIELKQTKIFDYDWDDIAFINTAQGYLSINEIKAYLSVELEVELYEDIKLVPCNEFKQLLIRSLLNRNFKIVMQMKDNIDRVFIRKKNDWEGIIEELPPLFLISYENFEVLKYENYPLNGEHWFVKWLLEKNKEKDIEESLDIIIKRFCVDLSNNRKKRNGLVNKVNDILEKSHSKKISERDVIVYVSESKDIREWLLTM